MNVASLDKPASTFTQQSKAELAKSANEASIHDTLAIVGYLKVLHKIYLISVGPINAAAQTQRPRARMLSALARVTLD